MIKIIIPETEEVIDFNKLRGYELIFAKSKYGTRDDAIVVWDKALESFVLITNSFNNAEIKNSKAKDIKALIQTYSNEYTFYSL